MDKQIDYSGDEGRLSSVEQQLKAANQQLRASEQQLRAANQQLEAAIQQLSVSEQRYSLAQQAANIGTWESNLESGEVTWAGQTHTLFGFAPDEFEGTREAFYELVHSDDREHVARAVELCLEEGKPYRFEHRIIRTDREVRWVSEMADVFKDEKGQPTRLVGVTVDITKRKKAEEALKAVNQQLEATNQQLRASEQQFRAANQQLRANEEDLKQTNHRLGERVKELNCLYGLSQLAERGDITLEEIFQELAELIPPSWQYPEITAARITFEGRQFKTSNFLKTAWIQSADIKVRGQKAGSIEVCYLKKRPVINEEPFLEEERSLLNALAERMGSIIGRKQAEEALEAANQQLQASEQQLRAANQQLQASEQQFRAANQQLEASNQQLRATEKQLVEEKERSHEYFDLAGSIMVVIDPDQKVGLVNQKGCEILGYKEEEEILGRNWFDSFLPESVREKTRLIFEQLMVGETGLMEYNENLVLTRSGQERIIDWHNAVITNDDGDIIEILASGMDITEHRRAEEALARSESIYRRTIENAQGVPYQLRFSDSKYIFMGSGVEELIGITAEELTQKSLDKIVKETIISDLCGYESLEAYCRAFEGGKLDRFQADVCVQTPQGEIKWFSDCSLAIRDEETGETTGCIGVLQDITKRKHTEAALAEQHNVLRTLIDNLPDSVYVKNTESQFVVGNIVTAHIMGLKTSEEMVGKTDFDFLPREMALKYRADEEDILRSGQPLVNREEPVANQTTGETIWHLTSKVPLRDSEGKVVGLVGIGRNITERKAAQEALKAGNQQLKAANQQLQASEQQLRAANQQLGATNQQLHASEKESRALVAELEVKNTELERFTYAVSHDLKSPLITIKGFLGMLERDAADGDIKQMNTDMARISNAAEKMRQLLDELLELSRVGRQVRPPEKVSLQELAREAVELVSGRITERGVQVGILPDMPVVSGDHPQLLNVMQNLIDNAVKFMGEQPEPCIEIGVREDDDEAVCYVRDNGIGIDRPYHEKIFGLFDKLNTDSKSTGVGLALVKRIIEVHGGRIWVESEGLGKGSTFCFTIPAYQDKKGGLEKHEK